ncbi:MAG: hypothetical protein ACI9MR_001103 [Myxococcota bacterium]|jgi:hypothetical protein
MEPRQGITLTLRRRGFCVALAALVVLFAACGDDGNGSQGLVPTDTSDTTDTTPEDTADTTPPADTEPPADTTPPAANALSFGPSMIGPTGSVCAADTACILNVDAGVTLDLAVVYTDGQGLPLADRSVKFATEAPAGQARLTALSVSTNDQGVAAVQLKTFGAGTVDVTAKVSSDPDAGELTITAVLAVPPNPVLLTSLEYVGQAGIAEFGLRLFKQSNGEPSCGSLHPDAGGTPPAPDLVQGPYTFGQQAIFYDLPGLADDGNQMWAIQYVGPAQGLELAVGCADNVAVSPQSTATELIYILDLPPNFRGDYQVVSPTNMLAGTEGTTAGRVMSGMVDLFTEPGRVVLQWACPNASGTLGTLCGYIVNDNGDLTVAGGVVADLANVAFQGLIASVLGENVANSGIIISEILEELRFLSVMSMMGEPSSPKAGFDGAYFAPGMTAETWTHVRFRWKFDPACKNLQDPSECGWTSIPLEDIYGHRPMVAPPIGVDPSYALHVENHTVSTFTLGPLLNAILEWRILPLLMGDGTTGNTHDAIDSWDDAVSVLFGDRECLYYDDCCSIFADKVQENVGTVAAFLAPAACQALIPLAAQVIRNRMLDLGGPLHIGTPAGQGCPSIDGDLDRWVDAYGSAAGLCDWDMTFQTTGGDFTPMSNWRATQ